MPTELHRPVLLQEVISFLPQGEGICIDCTLGTGGHTEALLKNNKKAKVIGIDLDEDSIQVAKERLATFSSRIDFIHGNFRYLSSLIEKYKEERIIFILYDLGFSSYQLKYSKKGFSFFKREYLDMRYSKEGYTAADIINQYPQDKLYYVLRYLGEERWASRIVKAIIKERKRHRINYTDELKEIILKVMPKYKSKLNPATRTFLALRIEVNDELEALKESLEQAIKLLYPGGRVCVISFHSGEDRIVKEKFISYEKKGILNILTKKPILPSLQEKKDNPLCSSAKLRCCEKK